MHVDVAIPTHESEGALDETLIALASAEQGAPITVGGLLIEDDESADGTRSIARDHADRHGWALDIESRPSTLPEARQRLIDRVESRWFLFLDDDVRVSNQHLKELWRPLGPSIGAVQGRKASRTEPASEWVRRRSRRGGCHATLVRREAAEGIDFPADMHVLEDEYLRRHIESQGYLWIFNHQAVFSHDCQDRHPIGWQEGRIAGKYGLKPFHEVALNVPFSLATGRNPWPHTKRAIGWLAGRLSTAETPAGDVEADTSPEQDTAEVPANAD